MNNEQTATQNQPARDQSLAVNIMETSLEVFKNGAAILRSNKSISASRVATGEDLLIGIEGADGVPGMGMDAATDQDVDNYIFGCNTTRKQLNDQRKPITQMFSLVASEFTAAENALDPVTAGSVPNRLQQHRNNYAKQQALKKQEEDRLAREKADKMKEAANLKSWAETDLLNYFSSHLLQEKQKLNNGFLYTDLDTMPTFKVDQLDQEIVYQYSHFAAWHFTCRANLHTDEEVKLIAQNVTLGKFNDYAARFKAEMKVEQSHLLATYDMRMAMLQQTKNASDEQRAQLLKDQEAETIRKNEEMERQHNESVQQQATAIETTLAGERTEAAFVGAGHGSIHVSAPKTATSWEITITGPAGYAMIFQAWMENEGAGLGDDAIQKKTVGQMIKYVAGLRIKTGYYINSPHVQYEAAYKAVTSRAKK